MDNLIEKHKLSGDPVNFSLANIPDQNWNEEWEKNFEPVIIANKFLIRAPFHFVDAPHLTTFTISPKMAFGTGHHSTTQLMIELMMTSDMHDKKVLDLGTGTGILAIFAAYFGAREIMAIDNSTEAIDCTQENIEINNCTKITASVSEIEEIKIRSFDIILANINRNTLTENASYLAAMLSKNDVLLISGFYEKDIQYISAIFEKENLSFKTSLSKNTWAACQYIKD